MIRIIAIMAGLLLLGGTVSAAEMLGFSEQGAVAEAALEAEFDAAVNTENLQEWMRFMSARPHAVGSPYGKEIADFIASKFESWGFETEIETFHILFPTPRDRIVTLLEPTFFDASLLEPILAEDATSGQRDEQLPGFHFFSVDGDVTAEVVYVNYGIPADYDELEKLGVSVEGKIVIARYGGSWRGIKPKLAAEKGAIGCIIYSDPRDDGYFRGDVYPEGAYRMADGIQRGSVMDMPTYPGDVLTPNIGATEDAVRIDRADAPTITKIPVLPISYSDAEPILAALSGPVAPEAWRGALALTYHVGPGPAKVRLKVSADWDLVPAYDVVAKLRGSVWPDQWVIRGNHHDAWVNGAADPVSGMVALMEEARIVGQLAANGQGPKRTIVYVAWDAEEPGLIGSTEWVEQHAVELTEKAVLYINTDGSGRGFLGAAGSHSLETLVNEVAASVIDPQSGVTVLKRRQARAAVTSTGEDRTEALAQDHMRIGALGSGSDYTPFLQHLGIASLNLGYGGENRGGSYHSIFDSFDHYTRFGDPGFVYGRTLVQTAGRITLRVANADVLPWDFEPAADTIGRYVTELAELADQMRKETAEENQLIEDGHYAAWADPTRPFVVPTPKVEVPHLNFAPLQNAEAELKQSAERYQAAYAAWPDLNAVALTALNKILLASEHALTDARGLKGRPWYIHHIYAPGFYTGYGVKTIPGVREAIEQRMWDEVEGEIVVAAEVISAYARVIDQASAVLEGE